ncbi:tRNA (adenosine(37)-N6)-dimethylallyltransferase MiaA [Nonlabens mediterrranea]|uniref:tRNA dimethylallyltransferase n=1 Tax=Nonlabens mediterrranea TaxID=1419947 RepID=A0ABS0A4A8_9FLAO|nr:tRNA (adenosine(37)-N6)-dimethylallyltransferase MiaA [Nonlabens mediterrranea]
MTKKNLIVIVGPTAVGKTSLSIAFAKAYQTEIISCDSRQFFKEMTVGTAVPSKEELAEAPHHFIQNLSIHDSYSVGDFERDAVSLIEKLFLSHDTIIMVGGSALYEKAVTHGLDPLPEVPEDIDNAIEALYKENGIEVLQMELKEKDPVYYNQVDLQNPRRLMRALGICRATGNTFTEYRSGDKQQRDFNIIKVGLEAPREELYARINKRVDVMLEQGLLNEAKALLPYQHLTSLKTVGYQELMGVFENNYDLNEGIRLVKRNSRRFAKRQMTWYRKDTSVNWFHYKTRHTDIVQRVSEKLMESNL